MREKIIKFILGLTPLIVFLAFWQVFTAHSSSRLFLFSSPMDVFNSLISNISNNILIHDTMITGEEAFLGFLIGNFFGITIGLTLWSLKSAEAIVKPYIIALGAIPIFSLAPMMIIWFGTGLYAKVMMAALSTVITAITQSYEGAKNVDKKNIKLFESFSATKFQIFFKLILPSTLIWLFNSLRLNIGFALLGAFVAEYISSDEGLGHRILKAGGTYDVALLISSIICLILLAYAFFFTILFVEKTILKWR